MSHLDDGRIEELLDGEVPSDELAAIQAHLAACEHCRNRLAAARGLADEADELLGVLDDAPAADAGTVVPLPRAWRPRWTRRLAWAASLVIAAGAGYLARAPQQQFFAPAPTPAAAVRAVPPARDDVSRREAAPAATPTMQLRDASPTAGATGLAATRQAAAQPAAPAARERAEEPVAKAADELDAAVADQARTEPARIAGGRMAEIESRTVAENAFAAPRRADSISVANRLGSLVPRDQVVAQRAAADTIGLAEAVERLGGSIRLVDGRHPLRVESRGAEVHVVYGSAGAEFRLAQRRVDERIVWRLVVPDGFPAESVAAIRARVND